MRSCRLFDRVHPWWRWQPFPAARCVDSVPIQDIAYDDGEAAEGRKRRRVVRQADLEVADARNCGHAVSLNQQPVRTHARFARSARVVGCRRTFGARRRIVSGVVPPTSICNRPGAATRFSLARLLERCARTANADPSSRSDFQGPATIAMSSRRATGVQGQSPKGWRSEAPLTPVSTGKASSVAGHCAIMSRGG
jgi:hypothetical protein